MGEACIRISSKSELGQGEGELTICKLSTPREKITSTTSKAVAEGVLEDVLDDVYDTLIARDQKKAIGNHLDNNTLKEDTPKDETNLLDNEIKQMIKDMKLPPEHIEPVIKPINKGIGDQITDKEIILPKNPKNLPIEKKARFTNLVRNSKHNLIKYFSSEKGRETMDDDRKSEHLLKVTELEEGEEGTSVLNSTTNTTTTTTTTSTSNNNNNNSNNSKENKLGKTMSEAEIDMANLRKGNSLRKRLVKAFERRPPAYESNPKKTAWAKFFKLLKRNPKEDES